MQYRPLGRRVTEKVSALGFGCMRLPTLGEPALIDEKQARHMVHAAIDRGVNYVDTAYPYHAGASEPFVGTALADGYREKVLLATKLPVWKTESIADCDSILHEQLERLQTDHIDMYLLHALDRKRWDNVLRIGTLEWALRQKREGKIRYIGFSFHDDAQIFPQILNGWDEWDFCQIQYNFVNEDHQAGTAGLELAAARGIGVVVMEPLLGGGLAESVPTVQAIWDSAPVRRSPVEWALKWLWNKPEVGVVLSGMSTYEQLEENLRIADSSATGDLSPDELALFPKARRAYDEMRPIGCTSCAYCMPCPNGVDIPGNFALINEAVAFNQMATGIWRYNNAMSAESRASECIICNECLDKCPQSIQIPDRLAEVHKALRQMETT